ncbi:MAG: hypothetical protein K0R90_746 [Oscillospiraceae bacterium]|jgi:homocitrate synthase NifV|nr:hypothetical protein [Oscillospiraceae bacterium]
MIRITDVTLTTLDLYDAKPELLRKMCEHLLEAEVDFIELSVPVYLKTGPLPRGGKYILRINDPLEAINYLEFNNFICRHNGYDRSPSIINEIQVNDMREINSLTQFSKLENVRLTGLDDILNHDYISLFERITKNISGRIELCPENRYYSATGIAVEWILNGGTDIVASFVGSGGFAPLEEVLLALRICKRHKPNLDLSVLQELKELYVEITGKEIYSHKAVIGEDIFDMEAGIHVNGIAKSPKMYEPYEPEIVGNSRKLIIGKHSGTSAIVFKCRELGLKLPKGLERKLLIMVQRYSIKKQASLNDEEFRMIYCKLMEDV